MSTAYLDLVNTVTKMIKDAPLKHTRQTWGWPFRTPPLPVRGSPIPWHNTSGPEWRAPRPWTVAPAEAAPSAEEVVANVAARVAELDDRLVELRAEQAWTERELAMRRPVLNALGVVEDAVNVAVASAAVLESEVRGGADQVRDAARWGALAVGARVPAGLLRQAREAREWYRWWKRGGE